ncbi:hypothetical protein OROGR_003566 [Orobanche gracilis]
MDDDFLINKYKIVKCPMIELQRHSSKDCIYLHPHETPRRHPSKYQPLLCERVATGQKCEEGDDCKFVHTMVEYRLHPQILERTPPCIFGLECDEDCLFPHRSTESEPSLAGCVPPIFTPSFLEVENSKPKLLKKPPSLEELVIQFWYTDDQFMSSVYKTKECPIFCHDCPLLHTGEKKMTQPIRLDISNKSPLCKLGKKCSRRPCILPHDAANAADPKSITNLDHIAPASVDELDFLFSHLLTNDHFMMNHYKRVKCRCTRFLTHDGTTCPFYVYEEEHRRPPCNYILSLCKHIAIDEECPMADDCPYIHTHTEHRLHRDIFLNTPPCIFGASCSEFPCFFPHGSSSTTLEDG